MVTAYDSVDVTTVPADVQFLMGYNSGAWPTYEPLKQRFPKARVLSIAVQADIDGDILDAEPGDATPDQVAGWVERQLARGARRPVVYTSVSQVQEVVDLLGNAGIARSEVRLWTAHYSEGNHLCGPQCNALTRFGFKDIADATQWTDAALGRNLDESTCEPEFWDDKTKPSLHYGFYSSHIEVDEKVYNEQTIVRSYDVLRNKPLSRIIPNRPRLKVLRAQCLLLADRCAREAIYEANPEDGKLVKRKSPVWGERHLGFRYAGLIHRSQGKRI